MIIDLLDGNRHGLRATVMDIGNRCAIDQQAEQFRTTIVAARIHQVLTPVDQGEIEIGNHHAFPERRGSPINSPSGETIAVKQPLEIGPMLASGILHDLGLLIGVEPGAGVNDEATGFEACWRMLTCGLLRETVAGKRARIHSRVNLLAIGHQGVSGQRIVMLIARQLTDAPDCAVDGMQPRTVALAPDHAFMVGRRNLATTLNQGAVSIEEQLRIVDCPAVAFVDSDGHHHSGLLAGFANCVGSGGWHGYGLVKQL